jgi:hypothetical protein
MVATTPPRERLDSIHTWQARTFQSMSIRREENKKEEENKLVFCWSGINKNMKFSRSTSTP